MNQITVAAIGMTSGTSVAANLQETAGLLAAAAAQGVQLAVLPENFAAFGLTGYGEVAEQFDQIRDWLAAQACQHGLWLVAGSLPCNQTSTGQPVAVGRVRAACLVFDPQGQLCARYDKIHLFDVAVTGDRQSYCESAQFEPGDQLVTVRTPFGTLGVLICYDLRFPEQALALRQSGADILCVPAAFTVPTGEAHWQLLLRARAIDTQCLVIGAAQGGTHPAGAGSRHTWGRSMIVDGWGNVLATQSPLTGPALAVAQMKCDQLQQIRARMPLVAHRLQAGNVLGLAIHSPSDCEE